MTEQYAIFKESQIVFAGHREVVERAFSCLHDCFYFVAGSANPRRDAFPYRIEQI